MSNPTPSFWHDVSEGVTLCQKFYTRGRAALIRQGDQTSARGRRRLREEDDGLPPISKLARTQQYAESSSIETHVPNRPRNRPAVVRQTPARSPPTAASSSGTAFGAACPADTARPPGTSHTSSSTCGHARMSPAAEAACSSACAADPSDTARPPDTSHASSSTHGQTRMPPADVAACSSAGAADSSQPPAVTPQPPLHPQLRLRAARNKQAALAQRQARAERDQAARARTAHNKSVALAKRAAKAKPSAAKVGWKIANATSSHFGTNESKGAANTSLTAEQRARVACSAASAASARGGTTSDAPLRPFGGCDDATVPSPPPKQARSHKQSTFTDSSGETAAIANAALRNCDGTFSNSSGDSAVTDSSAQRNCDDDERKLLNETTTTTTSTPTATDFPPPPPPTPGPRDPVLALLQGATADSEH